jgi:hypothetical protein
MSERQEQLKRIDAWLLAHPGKSWAIAIGIAFAFVGVLCVARMVLQFLAR